MTASDAYDHSTVDAPGRAFDGLVPAQSPRHSASATLAWQTRHGLSAAVRYIGKQYEDDLETDVLPATTTDDAVASVPVGRHVAIIGRAEYLFNATVVTLMRAARSISARRPPGGSASAFRVDRNQSRPRNNINE